MFSLSKIALFSLISFATLALAIPAPEPRTATAQDLLTGACARLANTIQPLSYCTPSNNTAYYIDPIVSDVTTILTELNAALKGSDLGCTVQELLELVANLLQIILGPLGTACASNSGLLGLVGELVAAIVALVQVVLGLVGPLVASLLALLIGNGCAGIIVNLGLSDLIACLGLDKLLGGLLSGIL
ncbi:hypothetical protein V8E53_004224 [Lactarius tabidus]